MKRGSPAVPLRVAGVLLLARQVLSVLSVLPLLDVPPHSPRRPLSGRVRAWPGI